MNVVSVMAHQDDEMRCLGTMLKCCARGDTLHFITLTDGSAGVVRDGGISRQEAAAIRQTEMTALVEAVGGSYVSLGEQDEFLYDTPEVRRRLIEAIRKTRADLIFSHFQNDYNQDHITVCGLVRHCAMLACLPLLPTESAPLAAHPAIFQVEPHGTVAFPASHYVDISDYFGEKVELLLRHRSQEEAFRRVFSYGLREVCSRLDAYRGDLVGCRYAECFVPMASRGALKPFAVLP
jgi:N-acetylglucosamine malate deacetylase 1